MGKSKKKRKKMAQQRDKEQPTQFSWIPRWGWVLIFVVPLIISEIMFYNTPGKTISMILFPVAWIGFWVSIMHRSGWPILKRKKEKGE